MNLEVSVSGSGLFLIIEDHRTKLMLTRDEAFTLLEAIEAALAGMPVALYAEPKTTSDRGEQQ